MQAKPSDCDYSSNNMGNVDVHIVNAFSAALNSTAFVTYIKNGGDPNIEMKSFWKAFICCLFLLNKSIFLLPVAFALGVGLLHPIPLLLLFPCAYYFEPPQPLIYYAIMAHNIKSVRLLVEHGVDLNTRTITSYDTTRKMTPLEFITCAGASPGCCTCCFSKEIVDLLTPQQDSRAVANV